MNAINLTGVTIKTTEADCQKAILDYLFLRKGITIKLEMGGKPLVKDGKTIMIPFKNEYYVNGISDIFHAKDGRAYFFEVKSPDILKRISNWDKCFTLEKNIEKKANKTLKNQYAFLKTAISKSGLFGGFVSGIKHVQYIIKHEPKYVYIPSVPFLC